MKCTTAVVPAFFFTLLFSITSTAQTYEPEIVVLSPNELKFEKKLKKEVKKADKEFSAIFSHEIDGVDEDAIMKSPDFRMEPLNMQRMMLAQMKFVRNLDLARWTTYMASIYLTYRFYEYFPDVLIIPSGAQSAGDMPDLRSHAENENMQYVLNFPEIRIYNKDGENRADLTVQLYDNHTQMLLLYGVFTGGPANPGFEFACDEGSVGCTVNNALMEALDEVMRKIAQNSPTIQREKELARSRFEELMSGYYSESYDRDFLDSVIPQSDSTVVLSQMYQLLRDPEDTKFIAFFLGELLEVGFGDMKDRKDSHVTILTGKDIRDEGFLTDIPRTYAYIVKGLKHDGKWYYEKSETTYFEPESVEDGRRQYFFSLAGWDFFKEGSTGFNPDFWEGYLFPKVESAVEKNRNEIEMYRSFIAESENKSDKDFYQFMIDEYYQEDEENREYLGMYEIVVKHLKKATLPVE